MTTQSREHLYDDYRNAVARTHGCASAIAEICIAGTIPGPSVLARYVELREAEAAAWNAFQAPRS